MNLGLNDLWPTKVMVSEITNKDILENVTNDIIKNYVSNPPNDFQKFDVLKDGGESFKDFQKHVVEPIFNQYLKEVYNIQLEQCGKYSFNSWLASPKFGYTIGAHNHSGSSLSAVFYIFCEEPHKGGELVLMDPRTNANRGYPDQMNDIFSEKLYTPKTGQGVIFPSFLYHHTRLFTGNLRIAMPVDFFPGTISVL